MIGEFFRFERREQMRSWLLWMFALGLGLLAFGAASSDAVQIGGGVGNVMRNAPSVVALLGTMFTLLGLLPMGAIVSHALLRDHELGTAELIFASPIRKRDYLGGRMLGALVATLIVYAVIILGIFVGQFMPWVDPARIGPIPWTAYGWTMLVIILPNIIFGLGLLALLAVTTRSILWIYIGLICFLIGWGMSQVLTRDLEDVWLAVLADPLGFRALGRTMRYWSAEERNTQLPTFAGYLLANRVLWTTLGLAMIAAAFALFRTQRSGSGSQRWSLRRKPQISASAAGIATREFLLPRTQPRFDAKTRWQQFRHSLTFDTKGVLLSVPFLILLLFGLLNFLPQLNRLGMFYGTQVHLVTSQVAIALQQSYSWLLVIVVLFYAGELVFKERSARMNEVADAMPMPNWVPLLAKLGALIAVIIVFQAIGAASGMLAQLLSGGVPLQPLTWLKILAADSVIYLLMGGMALAVQVLTNNKFAGYAVVILVMIGQMVLGLLHFEHNLYNFGSWPVAPWSDMNGYGHFLWPQLAFPGYWLLLLLALLLLSAAGWVRGTGSTVRERWSLGRVRLRGPLGMGLGASLVAFIATGVWLFWNTNIRNDYVPSDEMLDLQARYERKYKQYEKLPQPKIVVSHIDVDLQPSKQTMTAEGVQRIVNPYRSPIRDIHVSMPNKRALKAIDFGGQALILNDELVNYRIYRLSRPLQPGEQRQMRFSVEYRPNGIENGRLQHALVENGTFFNNFYFPSFGYDTRQEISDRNERRKRGLGEPRRMYKLEDQWARGSTYLGDDADWIDYSTNICTDVDQIALSPGYLKREYRKNGRRCFEYAMDRPMLNFYSVLSGRWKIAKGEYKHIPIEIYYHPAHAFNVQRMIEASQKSLDYFETHFSPYQHRQLRIIEFPGYATFAQSFANTVPFSESIGFIADNSDKDELDYVFYVTAHEIAHQWWGHQIMGANSQGGPMLVESLSQYSALMVMEKEYGKSKMRQFLKYELDRYLSGRGGEAVEELPLYRSENQGYIHYNKASLVFYRLREELGEEGVNRALSRFVKAHMFKGAPYPTSLDVIAELRREAKPEQQQLITDLFEKISFYDNRVEEVTASKRADGRYDVTLKLKAAKRYADGKGKETPGKMDDWIDVGVFADGPSGKERDEKVLYLRRHHIVDENPTITVTVDVKPDKAGFDPYNKLIDRVSQDNRKTVSM